MLELGPAVRAKWKKIREPKKKRINDCADPDHDPVIPLDLEPGTWEWVCPTCGQTYRLDIPESN